MSDSPHSVRPISENTTANNSAAHTDSWLGKRWQDLTIVAFDTETTGKYPLQAEICEIAAVKWRGGQIVDTFQSLVKPSKPMDAEVIAIHGITNDMVEDAPRMTDVIGRFHTFIGDAVLVAHHAPFDLGFVSVEFERFDLVHPVGPALCSSLLSRKLFPESDNHRLQTLIKFFSLEQGTAHRALDDAKACLEVGLRCLQKTGDAALLIEAAHAQGQLLTWQRFSLAAIKSNPIVNKLVDAIHNQSVVNMAYGSGSKPGQARRVHPMGIVRSLDGDFLVAYEEAGQRSKRYFLDKISSVELC